MNRFLRVWKSQSRRRRRRRRLQAATMYAQRMALDEYIFK